MNWAANEVIAIKPDAPEDIEKHARHISTSLKAKGLGAGKGCIPLPAFLEKVLERMKRAAQSSQEKGRPSAEAKPPETA